jgi:hypothetical protein
MSETYFITGAQGCIGSWSQVAHNNGDLITFGGPPIPIAAAMDDSAIRRTLSGLPSTPLEAGVHETMRRFAALRDADRLDTSDLEP